MSSERDAERVHAMRVLMREVVGDDLVRAMSAERVLDEYWQIARALRLGALARATGVLARTLDGLGQDIAAQWEPPAPSS